MLPTDNEHAGAAAPEPIAYRFGAFSLSVETLQLHRGETLVSLTPKAFDTLLVLLRHHHRVVSKDELFRAVWRDIAVSEDSLTQTISALRRALGDDPNHSEYIATVPRRGYRFMAPVVEVAPTAAPALEPPPAAATAGQDAPGPPEEHGRARAVPPTMASTLRRAAMAAGIVVLAGASLVAIQPLFERPDAASAGGVLHLALDVPDNVAIVSGGALSPDARALVFVGMEQQTGRTQLWLRSLDTVGVRPLPDTEGALLPFWSPDSGVIGFFADGRIRAIERARDSVRTIATMEGFTPTGGTWGPDGTILYSGWRSEILAVSATGSERRAVTSLDPSQKEAGHDRPQFLPDGRRFLFYVSSTDPTIVGTYAGSLDSDEKVRLVDRRAFYASGHLLFVRDGALMARPFDADTLRLSGRPSTLSGGLPADADISAAGDLLAFGGDSSAGLVWLDRQGQVVSRLNAPVALHNPVLSPDETHLAASTNDELRGVWLVDLRSGAATRLVPDGLTPSWSPDGTRLAFHLDTEGTADLYVRGVQGEAAPAALVHTQEPKVVNDWSAGGIVYMTTNPQTKMDLWLLPPGDGAVPIPIAQTPFNEMHGQLSPDGQWLAFASDESGTLEVYVQSMTIPGLRRTVSSGGGASPQWRRNGRELYYLARDRSLMVVDTTPGETWEAGRPRALFKAPVSRSLNAFRNHFAVTADGERFVFDAGGSRDAVHLLVNWNRLVTGD